MITADQVLCHVIGDYLLQSDWIASTKTRRSDSALLHATLYTLSFVMLTRSAPALALIASSHFVIDRWRLVRYVVWAKNWLSPVPYKSWQECRATGFVPEHPAWLTFWLDVIVDNTLHILLNGWVLTKLGRRGR
jgi:Protein of unknown function (DUF3307)